MAKGAIKKLSIPLQLNPAGSEADQAALDALQLWYEQWKKNHGEGNPADRDADIRLFHHDIYLAGLNLHRINPRLCRHLANALGEHGLTMEGLVRQLQACGLWTQTDEVLENAGAETAFTSRQLEQLQQMLERPHDPGQHQAVAEKPEAPDPMAARQLAEQGEQLADMHTELQQLRALAEQQAVLLQRLAGAGNTGSAPVAGRVPATEEVSMADLAPQAAQMEKIRKKGIF